MDQQALVASAVAQATAAIQRQVEEEVARRLEEELARVARPAPAPSEPARVRPAQPEEDGVAPDEGVHQPDLETVWRITLGGHEPTLGPRNAAITMVLWSSVDCALCRRQDAIVERTLQEYGGRARLVYKSHPQPLSEAEEMAAQAACAANRQGRFWEYRRRCAELNGARRTHELYANLAKEVGMDPLRFKRDMVSGACRQRMDMDRETAARVGIVSVPTLTVNGRRLPGMLPYEDLREVISEELAKVAALEVDGAAPENIYDLLIQDGEVQRPLAEKRVTFKTAASVVGASSPRHVLTVFGDYECPYTKALMPTLDRLLADQPDTLAVEFRNFPMAYHPDARRIALSVLEADAQGQFASFHRQLLELPTPLDEKRLARLAGRLKMDVDSYRKALQEGIHESRLDDQMEEARAAGVWATPSLFIDGFRYLSPDRSFEALQEVLQDR